MALLEPFKVSFPVDFRHEGDTTKDAFGKHIQEIERIYGIINAVNADKLSAEEFTTKFQNHIDSANPHPNLELENLIGNLPFSRITGTLEASKVLGDLTNAVIDKSKITGLTDYINGLINANIPPTPPDKGDGIINCLNAQNGYAKFNNGLIFQWGRSAGDNNWKSVGHRYVSFPITFPNACYTVIATYDADSYISSTAPGGWQLVKCTITAWTNSIFWAMIGDSEAHSASETDITRGVINYIAIGH